MNNRKYRILLYFILSVMVTTLGIQVYWNYKNYETSKQQLVNDVQTSLDNAVEAYYSQLAKDNTFQFFNDAITIENDSINVFSKIQNTKPDQQLKRFIQISENGLLSRTIQSDTFSFRTTDSLNLRMHQDSTNTAITIFQNDVGDSTNIELNIGDHFLDRSKFFTFIDSIERPVEALSSKIMISMAEESFSLDRLDSLFTLELQRKNIAMDYGLINERFFGEPIEIRPEINDMATLSTKSASPYSFRGNELEVRFTNITLALLKRNLLGMLLSFFLVAAVIGCLLYLLKIIQQQKQLAEVKSDLINNLTHEFKTPISTISVALEGIQDFNSENNTEKTQKYAKIGQEQVQKLSTMVEKLLETATLDSENLSLNKTRENIVPVFEKLIKNEAFLGTDKTIDFATDSTEIFVHIDLFHFENAIHNIIDNATKYGGDRITIKINKGVKDVEIQISDSGTSLHATHKKQLFEKFYRVPKGNTHDVKGYGIGLYYTQKIIEKHGGSISLKPQPHTCFKILLPYVQ